MVVAGAVVVVVAPPGSVAVVVAEPSSLVVDVGGSVVDAVLDELVELDVASGAGRRRSSGGSGKSSSSRPSMAAAM